MDSPKSDLQPRLRFLSHTAKVFGPGKAELLELIGRTGSLRAAAAQMGMSYNRAWILVREMNQQFLEPLVVSERGGASGGGATLTATGRELVARYARMERACRAATRADWAAVRRLLR